MYIYYGLVSVFILEIIGVWGDYALRLWGIILLGKQGESHELNAAHGTETRLPKELQSLVTIILLV